MDASNRAELVPPKRRSLEYGDTADAMVTVRVLPELTSFERTEGPTPEMRKLAPTNPAWLMSCVVLKVNVPVRPLAQMSLNWAMDD